MEILESIEVRWYLPRGASAEAKLKKWFQFTPDEGNRTDHYFATGRTDLSFKARLAEGKPAKVETKYLVGSLGRVNLAPTISGGLERWTKLSLVLNDPELKQSGSWLAVTKKRQLRKFGVTLTPALAVKEVAASEIVPIGCGVELTRLHYATDGTSHVEWTFGLEAFGPTSQLLDVMQGTVRAISPGMPALSPEWTASYATWMLRKIAYHEST